MSPGCAFRVPKSRRPNNADGQTEYSVPCQCHAESTNKHARTHRRTQTHTETQTSSENRGTKCNQPKHSSLWWKLIMIGFRSFVRSFDRFFSIFRSTWPYILDQLCARVLNRQRIWLPKNCSCSRHVTIFGFVRTYLGCKFGIGISFEMAFLCWNIEIEGLYSCYKSLNLNLYFQVIVWLLFTFEYVDSRACKISFARICFELLQFDVDRRWKPTTKLTL